MKRLLLIILCAVLLCSAWFQTHEAKAGLTANVSRNEHLQTSHQPTELTERRTLHSKTYDLGNNKFAIDSSIGIVHYQDSSGNFIDINSRFKAALPPWTYQMNEAGYAVKVLEEFTAGQIIEFSKAGEKVAFQPMALEWTNDLDQISQISMPQNVTPTMTNVPVELLPGVASYQGVIDWIGGYGPGIDFQYRAAASRLQKILTISGLSDLPPPPQYIIDGGDPVLRLNFIFDPSSGADIYVNGQLWNKRDKVTTFDYIEFRKGGETLWGFAPLRYWDSDGNAGQSVSTLERRGNSLYISVRVPYSWLQTATFPIMLDPTIEDQVGASSDDAFERASDGQMDLTSELSAVHASSTPASRQINGDRFDGGSFPANGDTIDVAFISVFAVNFLDVRADIYFEDAASGPTFTSNASDITNRTKTTNFVTWIDPALNNNAYNDSPSLVTPLQELVDDFTLTTLVVIWDSYDDVTLDRLRARTFDFSDGSLAATFHIEFTAGGVSVPTLTTANATDVSFTTVTGDGNITATGGENATARGFQYGIGAFTDNVSEAGSFGTGNFTLAITGLANNTEYQYRAFANNSAGNGFGASVNFTTLEITVPTLVTVNATDISFTTVTGQGDITSVNGANASVRGFQYGIGDFSSNVTESGNFTTGNYTLAITGLVDNTEYQYRAFAENSAGNGFGASVNFTTLDITVPELVTGNATAISFTTITGQGNIIAVVGGNATARGFQYGIGAFTDNVSESGDFGTGNFTLPITGLTDNTEYQYRAFATNPAGNGFGASVNFTTLDILIPVVVTGNATAITSSTATGQGNIITLTGANATVRGFQFGIGDFSSNVSESGDFSTGNYTLVMSGLAANTTYQHRAFATNTAGNGFGASVNFTTGAAPPPVVVPPIVLPAGGGGRGAGRGGPIALTLALLGVFSFISCREENAVMWLISGAVAIFLGLYWFDVFVDNLGLSFGILFLTYGLNCFAVAFRALFTRPPDSLIEG